MAMQAPQFKPGMPGLALAMPALALSYSPFLAIVISAQTNNQNQQTQAEHP
jgi:hypothetical protein